MIAASNFVTNQPPPPPPMHNSNNNNNNLSTSTSSSNQTSSNIFTNEQIMNNNNNDNDNYLNHQNNLNNNLNNNHQNNHHIDGNDGIVVEDNNIVVEDSIVVEEQEEESVDINISNVVTNFNVRCHLNLRQLATRGSNVVYRRERSIVLMKLRHPSITASIWSSGKITCTGATTEESAKCASRRVARTLQKLGYPVKFRNYRIVNVLGACRLPFGIKIHEFSDTHRPLASYEPELHPGATYRIKELKAVMTIFQTGSITITAPSITNVQLAVEKIYPLVYEYRKPKPPPLSSSSSVQKHTQSSSSSSKHQTLKHQNQNK
uniref:TATA box-binding protein-like 1 n=1 Tax=Dermatophagoides pteronyssinus TaxID=6956 RepID=A0A6P6Y6R2_DERPT|nr:TATA box-binding protein-like protein 1 [Dermatophagoides pteronyssinus]